MGEARRRKQVLGESYGAADINSQIKEIWSNIDKAIELGQKEGHECILIQCCRNHKGFHPDTIREMQIQLKNWHCFLDVPILIQLLPQGFKSSEVKLYDGFITVWCNRPEFQLWKALFKAKL